MRMLCADDCIKRDALIETHQSTVLLDRECQQVHISQLAWTVDTCGSTTLWSSRLI